MLGLGYRPDPPKGPGEKEDFDARGVMRAARVAARASNRHLIKSVLNQGTKGSCVYQATFQAVRASHVRQGVDLPELGSRLMGYWLGRAVFNETDVDAGSFLRIAFEVLNRFGFCPESLWPYTDQGDAWKTKPSLEAFRVAFDQKSRAAAQAAYYRIYEEAFDRVAAVKMALSLGHCVVFGTDVSDAFCANDLGQGPVSAPVGKPIAGGHAMCIVGYDGDVFDIVNSWGEDWGDGGYWQARADYIAWKESRDFWIVDAAPYYARPRVRVVGKNNILANMSKAERNVRFAGWVMGGSAIGMIAAVIIAAVVLLAGCATVPPPAPPPPAGTPSCETACVRLEQLGCSAARPSPAGAPCVEVCSNIEESGVVEYGVACVTTSASCAAADSCGGAAH